MIDLRSSASRRRCEGKTVETGGTPDVEPGEGSSNKPEIKRMEKTSEVETVETDDSNLIKKMIGEIDASIDDDKKNILLFNTLLESSNWNALAKIKNDNPKTLSLILHEIGGLVEGLYKIEGMLSLNDQCKDLVLYCSNVTRNSKVTTEDIIRKADDRLVSQ